MDPALLSLLQGFGLLGVTILLAMIIGLMSYNPNDPKSNYWKNTHIAFSIIASIAIIIITGNFLK